MSSKGTPEFCLGASVHPEADFIEPQLLKFDKKVAAGAQFFQTQGVFDLASFRRFMQYASQFNVKILAGIIVMASARMAQYMNDNVPGIIVSQDDYRRAGHCRERQRTSERDRNCCQVDKDNKGGKAMLMAFILWQWVTKVLCLEILEAAELVSVPSGYFVKHVCSRAGKGKCCDKEGN